MFDTIILETIILTPPIVSARKYKQKNLNIKIFNLVLKGKLLIILVISTN